MQLHILLVNYRNRGNGATAFGRRSGESSRQGHNLPVRRPRPPAPTIRFHPMNCHWGDYDPAATRRVHRGIRRQAPAQRPSPRAIRRNAIQSVEKSDRFTLRYDTANEVIGHGWQAAGFSRNNRQPWEAADTGGSSAREASGRVMVLRGRGLRLGRNCPAVPCVRDFFGRRHRPCIGRSSVQRRLGLSPPPHTSRLQTHHRQCAAGPASPPIPPARAPVRLRPVPPASGSCRAECPPPRATRARDAAPPSPAAWRSRPAG